MDGKRAAPGGTPAAAADQKPSTSIQPSSTRQLDPPFGKVSRAVLTRGDLSIVSRLVYALLTTYDTDGDSAIHPGIPRIMSDLGICLRTVFNALEELRETRIISGRRPRTGAGRGYVLEIRLLDGAERKVHVDAPITDIGARRCTYKGDIGARRCTKETSRRQEEGTPPPPPPSFDAFWKVYPVHQGKAEAAIAWKMAVDGGATPDELTRAATAYAARGKGRKWASFFLSEDTWRDFLPRSSTRTSTSIPIPCPVPGCGGEIGVSGRCPSCGKAIADKDDRQDTADRVKLIERKRKKP